MFCPKCGSSLRDHTLLDINLRGFVCSNDHVCFRELNPQQGGIPTAETIDPPPFGSDIEILKFWLTDPRARERLPNQLALACRRIVEIAEAGTRIPRASRPIAFCPTCGKTLSHFDSNDGYMEGLRCAEGHELWWRGLMLSFTEQGRRKTLSIDPDDEHLRQLIEFYTSDDQYIAPYVHSQLRSVLSRYRALDS